MAAVLAPHEHQPQALRAGHGFEPGPAKLALSFIAGYGAAAIRAIQGFYIHFVQININALLYEIRHAGWGVWGQICLCFWVKDSF